MLNTLAIFLSDFFPPVKMFKWKSSWCILASITLFSKWNGISACLLSRTHRFFIECTPFGTTVATIYIWKRRKIAMNINSIYIYRYTTLNCAHTIIQKWISCQTVQMDRTVFEFCSEFNCNTLCNWILMHIFIHFRISPSQCDEYSDWHSAQLKSVQLISHKKVYRYLRLTLYRCASLLDHHHQPSWLCTFRTIYVYIYIY